MLKIRQDNIDKITLWYKINKKMFKEVTETFYIGSPYLQLVRLERGWSLREMAKRAKVNMSFYHDFERGKRRAKYDFVKKVQKALTGRRPK